MLRAHSIYGVQNIPMCHIWSCWIPYISQVVSEYNQTECYFKRFHQALSEFYALSGETVVSLSLIKWESQLQEPLKLLKNFIFTIVFLQSQSSYQKSILVSTY